VHDRIPPNYAALLWDNDGVLVDTERLYFQATREAFSEVGVNLTCEHYFEYFLAQSSGTSRFASMHGLTEAETATIQAARNERYLQLLEREPIAIAGVRETLAALRPHFTMGIVTSSRRQHFEAMHIRTGLLKFFDFAITREDYASSKPAPDPYLAAVARTGLFPEECLAIEDTPRGLLAARAAAIDCWVIPTDFTRSATFPGATRVLDRGTDVSTTLLDADSV
jgi:HAD superfamily hydrolase (TIGR01509 family)